MEQMPRHLPLKRRKVVGSRKYRCREGVPPTPTYT
ncbi:hypothetical protein E2C01_017144 [Portunus trituberculatus]|uniref:Uncharacterized protein n=1 Tax=Portunus trituberculatus TaxID=210409 RepID=A0A5B7DST4_PORTR|nr:hypothetical protein [Portunus trituberculatus]